MFLKFNILSILLAAATSSIINQNTPTTSNTPQRDPPTFNTSLFKASNTMFVMYGNGELPITYIEKDFSFILQLTSKFNPDNSTKPIIYYYVDQQIELVAYGVVYPAYCAY